MNNNAFHFWKHDKFFSYIMDVKVSLRDKKFVEVHNEIRKKEKRKDETCPGLEYVDKYRNIAVAAPGEKDLANDLDDKGLGSKQGDFGPCMKMFQVEARFQKKYYYCHHFILFV